MGAVVAVAAEEEAEEAEDGGARTGAGEVWEKLRAGLFTAPAPARVPAPAPAASGEVRAAAEAAAVLALAEATGLRRITPSAGDAASATSGACAKGDVASAEVPVKVIGLRSGLDSCACTGRCVAARKTGPAGAPDDVGVAPAGRGLWAAENVRPPPAPPRTPPERRPGDGEEEAPPNAES